MGGGGRGGCHKAMSGSSPVPTSTDAFLKGAAECRQDLTDVDLPQTSQPAFVSAHHHDLFQWDSFQEGSTCTSNGYEWIQF